MSQRLDLALFVLFHVVMATSRGLTAVEIGQHGEVPLRRESISADGKASANLNEEVPVRRASAREAIQTNMPRKTAILLIGLMRNQINKGESTNINAQKDWLKHFMKGMVTPTNADVFIHTDTPVPTDIVTGLGDALKGTGVEAPDVTNKRHENTSIGKVCFYADCQYWHFNQAWLQMYMYEATHGFQYDVVIKSRTEVSVASLGWDLAGWETPKRIHMMSDMIWWGQRQDMQVLTQLFESIRNYYRVANPDPFRRPVNVKTLLDSLQRDPDGFKGNFFHNKLESLPYVDMGLKVGDRTVGTATAIANLQAASNAGMEIVSCDGKTCKTRCGDRFDLTDKKCDGYRDEVSSCLSGGKCLTYGRIGDYDFAGFASEKDLLHWILVNGLTICDLGAKANEIFFKGKTMGRHATDCDLK